MRELPKILIIDDDQTIRDVLETLLFAENVELLFAENGISGLKLAQEFQPDAILLDVMMPGLDGYEICRQIRSNSTLAETHVIMITALDDREARLTGLRAGADDFLTKPFDGLELQIRLKNIMRLNRYRNLVAERSRFHWAVEKAEEGYLLLDENGLIQYANQRALNYFHLPETYLGVNFEQQAQRFYQPHFPNNQQAYQANQHASYLVQPESATAHAFWLRVEVLDLLVGQENQRLLRISNATDEMSAYQDVRKIHLLVAHKLRTPAGLIYSSMSLLNSKMDLIPPEEIRPIVKIAWQGAERLVEEVLEILKFINAPIALADGHPTSLRRLSEIILAASQILELQEVTVRLPETLAETELGISLNAMELIASEILENSKKFHPAQTPQIEVRIEPYSNEALQIQFLDNGQLMTAEQISRAKQPYAQGEKWFTGEVSGMGLGIPLVAALVWQSGGKIRLANREDQAGICVSLILPLLK